MKWNPQKITLHKMLDVIDWKDGYKHFRSSSSGYISKKSVRDYIFNRYNNKCNYCSSDENLQIDHIESVLSCYQKGHLYFCNSIENLQLLCKKCNLSKKP